jgi:hypothetical protein
MMSGSELNAKLAPITSTAPDTYTCNYFNTMLADQADEADLAD